MYHIMEDFLEVKTELDFKDELSNKRVTGRRKGNVGEMYQHPKSLSGNF